MSSSLSLKRMPMRTKPPLVIQKKIRSRSKPIHDQGKGKGLLLTNQKLLKKNYKINMLLTKNRKKRRSLHKNPLKRF
jgi:hypothetical protein